MLTGCWYTLLLIIYFQLVRFNAKIRMYDLLSICFSSAHHHNSAFQNSPASKNFLLLLYLVNVATISFCMLAKNTVFGFDFWKHRTYDDVICKKIKGAGLAGYLITSLKSWVHRLLVWYMCQNVPQIFGTVFLFYIFVLCFCF